MVTLISPVDVHVVTLGFFRTDDNWLPHLYVYCCCLAANVEILLVVFVCVCDKYQTSTQQTRDVEPVRRRWANVKTTQVQCLVLAGNISFNIFLNVIFTFKKIPFEPAAHYLENWLWRSPF